MNNRKEKKRLNYASVIFWGMVLLSALLWFSESLIRFLWDNSGGHPLKHFIFSNDFHEVLARIITLFTFVVSGIILGQMLEKFSREKEKSNEIAEDLRITLNSIGDGVISTCVEGKIRSINPVAQKLTGWSEEDAIGKTLPEVFHIINSETRFVCQNPAEKVLQTGKIIGLANHTALISKDGTEYQIADSGAPIFDRNHKISGVVLVFRDVSEKYSYEQKIRESEEKFALFMNYLPASAFIKDHESRYLFANEYFINHFALENPIGKDPKDFFLDPVVLESIKEGDRAALTAGHNIRQETIRLNDGSVHTYQTHRFPIFRENLPPLLGGIAVDMTEMLELENKMLQSQKMEAIGQLAGGVAHDFNNMLAVIFGSSEMLAESVEAKDKELVEMILEAATRAADLTSNLLSFARKGSMGNSNIEIHPIILRAIEMLKRTIDKKIAIRSELLSSTPMIFGNATQIQNALLNLGINAGQATDQQGTLSFSTSDVYLDEAFCKKSPFEIKSGDYICINVSDSGKGIHPEDMKRIFEPFFTTKKLGEGTGLGLSAVYGIIQEHHGAIEVESEVGKGTSFLLYLPLANQKPRPDRNRASKTILIVDDESAFRKITSAMIEKMGYDVLTAENGNRAIEIYKEKGDEIDLLLLDMIMPEKNGEETLNEIYEMDPEVKVVIASGFNDEISIEGLRQKGVKALLRKPFKKTALSEIVSQILET